LAGLGKVGGMRGMTMGVAAALANTLGTEAEIHTQFN